jgi:hypothetical protein
MGMRKRKANELEPMPRAVRIFLIAFAFIFVALVLLAGKFYLPNWKGNIIFLPVALFTGLLLVAAIVAQISRRD